MDYFFSTKQLTVGYDGKPLIRDIQIGLKRGRILTLIGPNGAGKSTILKTITKHLKSIGGAVYIDGCSIDDMSSQELATKASVVLTQRIKTEMMTCEDVVSTGRYPYTGMLGILSEEDKRQVKEAMELVDVTDLRHMDFNHISDGQRQRVLLARAICQQPQVIVLDEPTSYLDIRYKLEFLHTLREMACHRNIAVLMSLHELDLAERVSDEVMCVKGEYISHYGKAADIFNKELIQDLYDIRIGSYNPLFGTVELPKPQGEPKVFVIAGGGTGIPVFRALQKNNIPFIAGILHQNDIDYTAAMDLAAEVIAERAFEEISDEIYSRAAERISSCGTVINCLCEYGIMNEKNQMLLTHAQRAGCKIADVCSVISGNTELIR